MTNYCTFFDQGYLSQGLALGDSIRRHQPDSVLWVLAMDDETAILLNKLVLDGLHVISLGNLLAADPHLASVRPGRSKAEFAFTVKSCFCRYLLKEYGVIDALFYLDSDLFFFGKPALLGHELLTHSILIVPHRYPRWHDDGRCYGRFNAGVIGFRNDEIAHRCLDSWREQCLESCDLDGDGRRYGDQKYLDDWPDRYGGAVRIVEHSGVNLAPWNWVSYKYSISGPVVIVDDVPLVLYHFAQFRWVSARWVDSGQLEYGVMPLTLRSAIYGRYMDALVMAEGTIRTVKSDYRIPLRGWRSSLGPFHLALLRLVCGQYWLKFGRYLFAGRFGLERFSGRAMAAYRRWQRRGR